MKIILNCAQSIDGKLGYVGEQTELSNDEDWKQVHLLREKVDAILIGGNTARTDNPSLLVKQKRLGREPRKQPARIVITESGDLPENLKVFQTPPETIIFTTIKGKEKISELKIENKVKIFSFEKGRITPELIVETLEKEGFQSLLVEGGATIFSMFLKSSLQLEFRAFTAPVILGEENTVPLTREKLGVKLKLLRTFNLGDGIVSYYLKE